jgi:hypothetical protein
MPIFLFLNPFSMILHDRLHFVNHSPGKKRDVQGTSYPLTEDKMYDSYDLSEAKEDV